MIKHIEVVFLARNYQHLTGLNMIDEAGKLLDHHSEFFYKKCVEKKLSCDEIVMRMDGTTQLKWYHLFYVYLTIEKNISK